MAERPEDLNLPSAVVCRIVKDALPPNTKVTKEAQAAIAKVIVIVEIDSKCFEKLLKTKISRSKIFPLQNLFLGFIRYTRVTPKPSKLT